MRIICAWCNKQMNTLGESGKRSDNLISHSICPDCSDNLDFQLGVSLDRFLESLKFPVIILDGEGLPIAVNGPASGIQTAIEISGHGTWSDKIYECSHARLPERCSKTVHCSGCTIRMVATDTYHSGEDRQDVPAQLKHCPPDTNEKTDLLISAKKIGEIVYITLIRI